MDMITFLQENFNLFLLSIAALSLLVGSFLNVVIHRLPRMIEREWGLECREYLGLKSNDNEVPKINLWLPASHCPGCQNKLKPWHNIPVISFFLLKGQCAFCQAKISWRYPFIEILCCIASMYVAWRFGVTYQTIAALIFTWILIALTFIDLDCQLLPDQLTYLLFGLGLFCSLFNLFCHSEASILGGILGYIVFALTQGLFYLCTKKVGMGEGDYKLLAGLGAFLGWQMLPLIIILSSLSGMVFGLTHMAVKKSFKSVPLPFGPYLAVAGWIGLIWGNDILRMYLHAIQ